MSLATDSSPQFELKPYRSLENEELIERIQAVRDQLQVEFESIRRRVDQFAKLIDEFRFAVGSQTHHLVFIAIRVKA